jgi:hypothetical protein
VSMPFTSSIDTTAWAVVSVFIRRAYSLCLAGGNPENSRSATIGSNVALLPPQRS